MSEITRVETVPKNSSKPGSNAGTHRPNGSACLIADSSVDSIATVRLLFLMGGLTHEQKQVLDVPMDRPVESLLAGCGIPPARLAAVRRVLGEIDLVGLVEQHKGLKGEEARRFREEVEAFHTCERMSVSNGKPLSLVRFLVMDELATLPDIDGALIKSGAVRKALEYVSAPAPRRSGAQTAIMPARKKGRPGGRAGSSRIVRRVVVAAVAMAISCGGYAFYWLNSEDRVMEHAIYRDIDFSDFASEANRRQHFVNLRGLYRIMDQCARYGDVEGIGRSREAIAGYLATIRRRDPEFETESPALYREIRAYGQRVSNAGR